MVGTVKKSSDTIFFTWVIQESPPRLGRRSPAANHVFTHTGFADLESQFEQFTVDLRSAPEWVFVTHGSNQLAHFLRHHRPPGLAPPNLPGPEQSKALAMPADDGGGFHDADA